MWQNVATGWIGLHENETAGKKHKYKSTREERDRFVSRTNSLIEKQDQNSKLPRSEICCEKEKNYLHIIYTCLYIIFMYLQNRILHTVVEKENYCNYLIVGREEETQWHLQSAYILGIAGNSREAIFWHERIHHSYFTCSGNSTRSLSTSKQDNSAGSRTVWMSHDLFC